MEPDGRTVPRPADARRRQDAQLRREVVRGGGLYGRRSGESEDREE